MYDSLIYAAPIAAALTALSTARATAAAAQKSARQSTRRNERGEGVISAAIAVLIIASLGALMWVGFRALWENAEETTNSEIAKIGK